LVAAVLKPKMAPVERVFQQSGAAVPVLLTYRTAQVGKAAALCGAVVAAVLAGDQVLLAARGVLVLHGEQVVAVLAALTA
jgi:hypothetical protein